MSRNRDIPRDRARTREALASGPLVDEDDGTKNWLGHKMDSGAAAIDEMLLSGATMEQMKATRDDATNHINHLADTHGLQVIERGGIYVFDGEALGQPQGES